MKVLSIIFCLFASTALAENRIVVGAFTNASDSNQERMLAAFYPDLLLSCLSKNANLEIMDRDYLHYLANEQAAQNNVNTLNSAQLLINGHLTHDGVYITMANIHTSEQLWGKAFTPAYPPDCPSISAVIVDMLPKKKSTALPVDEDPERNKLFTDAMNHFYSGDYHTSIALLMKILSKNEEDADARYWLAKSYEKSGMEALARIEIDKFITRFPHHKLATTLKEKQ